MYLYLSVITQSCLFWNRSTPITKKYIRNIKILQSTINNYGWNIFALSEKYSYFIKRHFMVAKNKDFVCIA